MDKKASPAASATAADRESSRQKNARPAGRAIVTYGRSLMSLVIARSLHERGIEVIGCDDVDMTVLSFSKHVKDNFRHTALDDNLEQALTDFEEAVRRFAPDDDRPYVLIPAFRDASVFARYRERFEPLIRVAAPSPQSIQFVHPKDHFAAFGERHGLAIPHTDIVHGRDWRSVVAQDAKWPRIVKPADGVGGRGVKLVKSPEDLDHYTENVHADDTILVQEAIDGEDYCVSVAAAEGVLTGAVVYKNLRQFPIESGAGAVRETVDATPFLPATRKLLAETNWHGVAEIDFRWNGDPAVEPTIIEVNPRFWAGLFHSTASGVDFPYIAFCQAAGIPVPPFDPASVEIGFQSRTSGAWLLSVAEEVSSSDPHLEKAREAWATMGDELVDGHKRKSIAAFAKALTEGTRGLGVSGAVLEKGKDFDHLPSELSVDDDPAVGLGALFAVSSLLRHGKLPDELVFDVKQEPKRQPKVWTPEPDAGRERPVIGITKPDDGDWLAYQCMRFAVRMAGGEPVKITSRAPREPHSIDGLLFGGGSDVYPELYAEAPATGQRYDRLRDEMEADWAETAVRVGIPMLGICRGMQMMNVLDGGTLWPDLSQYKKKYPTRFLQRIFYRKPVEIEDNTTLDSVTDDNSICVNSVHTQAIKDVGPSFRVTAREPNGLIQAIEATDGPFRMGVQFHPEFLIYRAFARQLFERFIEAASTYRAQKKPALTEALDD
ncbi:gamma-glutamyl-gamma-aminobutyrate hydrolase family protein [Parvularcula sp. LCG005]|uniref:gamma-glutamyl-gamma-aminobutyrate hydrolase family protein n=1 Tax=Parvularcula sp. LCG005 TaxID=3078805 RepID=UPI002941EBC6|nr:gamma-glutamyl-gamma-aminobutyrate hydrolase family protein [Parvularcula sp. LCG005]WOI52608.1 gamma-glutamyl-gamma-aminobutyrate hydrolase family protein [Parvularcula sp. LCG005]